MTDNKHWLYLEALRKTGKINMHGAAPFLEKKFKLKPEEADEILWDWMMHYNPDDYKS